MNILFLTITPPYPTIMGYKLRCFNILKKLNENNNNNVTLVSFYREETELDGTEELEKYCSEYYRVKASAKNISSIIKNQFSKVPYHVDAFKSNEFIDLIKKIKTNKRIDAVYCNMMFFGQYLEYFDKTTIKILDQHDFDSYRWKKEVESYKLGARKIFSFINYMKTKQYEKDIYPKFDICFSVSEEDMEMSKPLSEKTKFFLAANGVDTKYFNNRMIYEKEERSILFTGGSSDRNVQAIRYFYEDIYPYLKDEGLKIYIAGNIPKRKLDFIDSKDFIITGRVDDIREYFEKSLIYIAPFKLGGGTKLKILEAGAMELPIVATNDGARGIDLKNNEEIFINNSEKEFAKQVLDIISNSSEGHKVGMRARKKVVEKYEWNNIALEIENQILRSIGERNE